MTELSFMGINLSKDEDFFGNFFVKLPNEKAEDKWMALTLIPIYRIMKTVSVIKVGKHYCSVDFDVRSNTVFFSKIDTKVHVKRSIRRVSLEYFFENMTRIAKHILNDHLEKIAIKKLKEADGS